MVEKFQHYYFELSNQDFIKVAEVLELKNKTNKTLGIIVIYSPMSPPFLD